MTKLNEKEKIELQYILYNLLKIDHILSANQLASKVRVGVNVKYRHITPQYLNKMIIPKMLESKKIGVTGTMASQHDYRITDPREMKEAFEDDFKVWSGKGEKPSLYFPYEFTNTVLKPLYALQRTYPGLITEEVKLQIKLLEGCFMSIDFAWPLHKDFYGKVKLFDKPMPINLKKSGNIFVDRIMENIVNNKELIYHLGFEDYQDKKAGRESVFIKIQKYLLKIGELIDKSTSQENIYNSLKNKEEA